mgnify:CR=1 FL=1
MKYRADEESWEGRARQLKRRVNELEKEKIQLLRQLRPFESVIYGPGKDAYGEPKRVGCLGFRSTGPSIRNGAQATLRHPKRKNEGLDYQDQK